MVVGKIRHFSMKTCNKCHRLKSLDEFTKDRTRKDGHSNKCKICGKEYTALYRILHPDVVSATEQRRNKSDKRRTLKQKYDKIYRENNPEKCKAHRAVAAAIRNGHLLRKPCEVCQNLKSEAHHHDYSKPLDVKWLCFKCHREIEHNQIVVCDKK